MSFSPGKVGGFEVDKGKVLLSFLESRRVLEEVSTAQLDDFLMHFKAARTHFTGRFLITQSVIESSNELSIKQSS
jgi:hypothetical protein